MSENHFLASDIERHYLQREQELQAKLDEQSACLESIRGMAEFAHKLSGVEVPLYTRNVLSNIAAMAAKGKPL